MINLHLYNDEYMLEGEIKHLLKVLPELKYTTTPKMRYKKDVQGDYILDEDGELAKEPEDSLYYSIDSLHQIHEKDLLSCLGRIKEAVEGKLVIEHAITGEIGLLIYNRFLD